jgi:hypothetical protein
LFVESLAAADEEEEEEEEEDAEERKRRKNEANRRKKLRRSSRPADLSIYMPVSQRPLEKQQRPRPVSETGDKTKNVLKYPQNLNEITSASIVVNRPGNSASVRPEAASAELHPSWEAKKLLKEKLAYTKTVHQGKKIVFNEDD